MHFRDLESDNPLDWLTGKQLDAFFYRAQGLTYQQIADLLGGFPIAGLTCMCKWPGRSWARSLTTFYLTMVVASRTLTSGSTVAAPTCGRAPTRGMLPRGKQLPLRPGLRFSATQLNQQLLTASGSNPIGARLITVLS